MDRCRASATQHPGVTRHGSPGSTPSTCGCRSNPRPAGWQQLVTWNPSGRKRRMVEVHAGHFWLFSDPGMHLLAGRNFSEQDSATSLPVVIVNQTFVRNFVNGPNPVGQTVLSRAEPNYPATRYQIIGVVNDARYSDLKDEIPPQAFVPESQFTAGGPGGILFVRSRQTPTTVIPAVRDKLRQIAPQMRTEFDLLESQVEDGLVRERLMAGLSGFFGALAVILAAIGLYGLIAYMVAGRTNEIGIRLALGASRRIIAWHIVREVALLGFSPRFGARHPLGHVSPPECSFIAVWVQFERLDKFWRSKPVSFRSSIGRKLASRSTRIAARSYESSSV